jgi:hypothetical protein
VFPEHLAKRAVQSPSIPLHRSSNSTNKAFSPKSRPLINAHPLPPSQHLALDGADKALLGRELAQLLAVDGAVQRHDLKVVPMRAMLPDRPRAIPDLVAAHGTVLEAAAELAAKEAPLGLVEVGLGHARLGRRDAVEDAEQDGARERDVDVLDHDEVLVHAARRGGQVRGRLPREGRERVVAVAGVVRREGRPRRPQLRRRDGHVGMPVLGQDVVAPREQLARPVCAVFRAGEEPTHGRLEQARHFCSQVEVLFSSILF